MTAALIQTETLPMESITGHLSRRMLEHYSRAASLAAVTCRVQVPMMGGFPFAHLA